MYTPERGESIVVQDIGPVFTQRWREVQAVLKHSLDLTHKMKMAMLDIPGPLQQEIERILRATQGRADATLLGPGVAGRHLSLRAIAHVVHLIPEELKRQMAEACREDNRGDALRKLVWVDIEQHYAPHILANLGLREHTENGEIKVALVSLDPRIESEEPEGADTPANVDGFLKELFGGADGDTKAQG